MTKSKKDNSGVGPRLPQVVVLVGATGDLARRKLLPGLYHLDSSGFMPDCRIIGVSLDDIDAATFRQHARSALEESDTRKLNEPDWKEFADTLDYVSLKAGPAALAGPFPDHVFCPTGGVTRQNAAEFLALPNVLCVGGSWLAPQALLDAQDWPQIEQLARDAASLRKA